jgi:hypothetical protein
MQHHRFRDLLNESASSPETGIPLSTGFVPFPLVLLSPQVGGLCAWQQMIYQTALQQSQNQRRTPLPNYELASAWN